MKNKKEILAIVAQSFIVGLSFLFIKSALNYTDSITILSHRFVLCVIFSTIFMKFKKEKPITTSELIKVFPYALLLPILLFPLQTFGLMYISSSEAGLIFAMIPILTLILARIFLKETSSSKQTIFILISVLGTVLNAILGGLSNENFNLFGIILMNLAVLTISVYNVSVRKRKATEGESTFRFIHLIHLWGGGIFLLLGIGNSLINHSLSAYIEPFTNLEYLFSLLYLSILSSLTAAGLLTFALKKLKASVVGVFTNFATILTLLAGILILNEPFFPYYVLTTLMILIGVLGVSAKA